MLDQSILVGHKENDAGICAVTRAVSRRVTCINMLLLRTRLPIRCQMFRQADYLADARPRRWCGSLAVQEAAMYRRLVLITSMSLSLAACVPYYDGGSSYYRSEIYSSPAPVYYGGALIIPTLAVITRSRRGITLRHVITRRRRVTTNPHPVITRPRPGPIAHPPVRAGTVIATRGGVTTTARAISAGNNKVGRAGATMLTGVVIGMASTMVVVSVAGATVRSGNRQAAHPAPLFYARQFSSPTGPLAGAGLPRPCESAPRPRPGGSRSRPASASAACGPCRSGAP